VVGVKVLPKHVIINVMREEISSAKDRLSYVLGFACLLAPILILFCEILGGGEFLAFGSYIVSSQNFVESTTSFLLSSLGREFCGFLWVMTGLIWFFGGIISLVVGITNFFRKKWSHRKRIFLSAL